MKKRTAVLTLEVEYEDGLNLETVCGIVRAAVELHSEDEGVAGAVELRQIQGMTIDQTKASEPGRR